MFPATGLDDERHVAFAQRFGELERRKDTGAPSRMSLPELTDQGNVDANGNVIGPDDPRAQISKVCVRVSKHPGQRGRDEEEEEENGKLTFAG